MRTTEIANGTDRYYHYLTTTDPKNSLFESTMRTDDRPGKQI